MSTGIEDQHEEMTFWQAWKPFLVVGAIFMALVFVGLAIRLYNVGGFTPT